MRRYYKSGPSQGVDYSILDRKPGSFNLGAFTQQPEAKQPEGETVMIMGQAHFIPRNGEAPTQPPPAEEGLRPEVFHFDVSHQAAARSCMLVRSYVL
jgi:hypothetical protein